MEYGAGLVVPFAIDKLGKGSVKGYKVVRSLEDGKATYKVVEAGQDIGRQEDWLFSIYSARSREEATQMMQQGIQHLDEVVEGFYDGTAKAFSQLDGVTVETVAQISKDILNLAPALVKNPGLLTKELAEAIVEAGTRRAEFLDEIAQLSDESLELLVEGLGGRTDLAEFMGREKGGVRAWEVLKNSKHARKIDFLEFVSELQTRGFKFELNGTEVKLISGTEGVELGKITDNGLDLEDFGYIGDDVAASNGKKLPNDFRVFDNGDDLTDKLEIVTDAFGNAKFRWSSSSGKPDWLKTIEEGNKFNRNRIGIEV